MALEFDTSSDAAPDAVILRRTVAIRAARAKLSPTLRYAPIWPLVGAAALAAVSALGLAAAVIAGPPHL